MQVIGWVLMRRGTFLAAPCLWLGNQTAVPVCMQSREQRPLVCSGAASRSLRLTDGHLGDLCIPVEHSSVLRLPEFRRNKYLQLCLLERVGEPSLCLHQVLMCGRCHLPRREWEDSHYCRNHKAQQPATLVEATLLGSARDVKLLKDRVELLRFEVWGFSAVTIVCESSFDRNG